MTITAPLPSDRPPSSAGELPGILRAVAIGSAIGMVLALALVGGGLLLAGRGSGVALGVGGVAAFWGGLGFGSMLGGTLFLVHQFERDDAEERNR
jgi:hypothetical protein